MEKKMKRFSELKQGDTIYYVRKNDRSGKMSLKKCTVDEVTPTGDKGFISGIPYERSYFIYASCGEDSYEFMVDIEASQSYCVCTEPDMVNGLAEGYTHSRVKNLELEIEELKAKIEAAKKNLSDFRKTAEKALSVTAK